MTMPNDDAIAIVGFGGVFPGAGDPDRFWDNIVAAVDATAEVPPGRWILPPARAYDPRKAQPDRVYSTRGGLLTDFQPDLSGLNLDPELAETLDPVFLLALHAARRAWDSARTRPASPERVGVILGNIVLPTERSSSFSRAVLGRALLESLGLASHRDDAAAWNAYPAGLPAVIVAQALGLGGPAFTLDAACASSLFALKLAAEELRAGRCDAMLAGGLSRPDPLYTQMGFSQLLALSERGKPSPFGASADGLVVGEGAGVFVLKRLSDAVREGDDIHGLIRGIGLSNDLHGDLMAPKSEGQLRAMRAAYEEAGWTPQDVDLIECHATGTPVGDAVEIESLKQLWGGSGQPWAAGQCVIGSVKSNVGHMLTAAGAAGLVKVLMAFRHRVLPPTANLDSVSPRLQLDGSPFHAPTQPAPWPARAPGQPRRAAINGFGFGGINAHLLIEEWLPAGGETRAFPSPSHAAGRPRGMTESREIAIVGMSAQFGGCPDLRAFQEIVLGGRQPAPPAPPRPGRQTAQSLSVAPVLGRYLDAYRLRVDQYRIPPSELAEMLPQQSLMLKVACEAVRDASWKPSLGPRTGVLVGLGLDQNTNNYELRWWLASQVPLWNRTLGLGLSDEELERWIAELLEAAGPALTANRTMGSLGGVVASRIARTLHIGGPCFSVSCDEASSHQALKIAADWLHRRELDAVVVGAVDLAGDPRAVRAASALGLEGPPGEGAAAVVLRRLEDARRDGDRVYAVYRAGAGLTGHPRAAASTSASGEVQSLAVRAALAGAGIAAESVDLTDLEGCAAARSAISSVRTVIGRAGVAGGLASVVKAALCLYQRIMPSEATADGPNASVDRDLNGRGPCYWLRNREDGPRRAGVTVVSLGGSAHHLVLEEAVPGEPSSPVHALERVQPLGARRWALFGLEADDRTGLLDRTRELARLGRMDLSRPIEALARDWWRAAAGDPRRGQGLGRAVVAENVEGLLDGLRSIEHDLENGPLSRAGGVARPDVTVIVPPTDREGPARLAFVYPGLGSAFPGMGRALSALWPEVLRAQERDHGRLSDLYVPETWRGPGLSPPPSDHRRLILAQVALGSLVTEILGQAGVRPDAAIGYSMGESTALVALGAWTEREDMTRRLLESPLFATELAGPCEAARRCWGLDASEPTEWTAGIVPCSVAAVERAIGGRSRVHVLIRNSPAECVIGGHRPELRAVVKALGVAFLELPAVSTVHCPIGASVAREYRTLHDVPTRTPEGITFYSGVSCRPYAPDRSSAADAIAAQASGRIDFARLIERAYADGVRVFLEVGPGTSCSRLIGQVLGERPHLAWSACAADRDPLRSLLESLGRLFACRIPVRLEALYGGETHAVGHRRTPSLEENGPRGSVAIEPGFTPPPLPPPPSPASRIQVAASREVEAARERIAVTETQYEPAAPASRRVPEHTPVPVELAGLTGALLQTESARASAHAAYLKQSQELGELAARAVRFRYELIEAMGPVAAEPAAVVDAGPLELNLSATTAAQTLAAPRTAAGDAPALDRPACLEFAVGRIGAVLGPGFAAIDAHPTRVRLPDEPLMLVDRILTIEGEPRSLTRGRVVTEHDVLPGAWYLDGGRICPCIAIESGQADLFLSGYLGIDFETRGLAVYRLLDATVTFHRSMPGPGAVIRYDIRITRFFRQGETHLFRFEFDGTVDGEPLLTMRDGCAGFFTAEDLSAGKGVVPRPLDALPRPGVRPDDWVELVPASPCSLDARQVEALRRGDLATAFGAAFERLGISDLLPLPGGRMTLVDRVESLDPKGGRFGLGLIRAEADVHPDDWYMVCHFVDDRVMPGTLMYECCLHTLRILLMRLGWVGPADRVAFEPLPGVANRLRCRGQVIESTRRVTYQVEVKELGYGPEPYAIADALMFADGKPIVEITNMALRLAGTDKSQLEALWKHSRESASPGAPVRPTPGSSGGPEGGSSAGFDRKHILEFATGKPSRAFGARYLPFDEGRFIARLPAPPYSFLDRIAAVDGAAWSMAAGTSAVAEYDIPSDGWYFAADRQDQVPYAVLLETALQACGWLAAYMGSALSSETALKFRNLGGTAVQHARVQRRSGTLRTRVQATKVTRSAGMIIQHYDFAVTRGDELVFDGSTYFGFFHPDALAEQVGIREASPHVMTAAEASAARSFPLPDQAPFPDARWRMIETVTAHAPRGGPHGLGLIEGAVPVDPRAWFFQAHFLGDPVWPGSLGLESLLQLLKVVAVERWGGDEATAFDSPGLSHPHRWLYRGQILPTNRQVTTQAVITASDEERRWLMADGYLAVDGKVIYQMNDFTLRHGAPGT